MAEHLGPRCLAPAVRLTIKGAEAAAGRSPPDDGLRGNTLGQTLPLCTKDKLFMSATA
jgi:hypothetical protein